MRRFLILVSVILLTALPGGAVLAEERVTINFKDTDIREVAEMVSKVTGRNFLVDPRVKGKVTVISAEPIDGEQLYSTFLTILKTHGFIAVDEGELVQILPASGEREHATFSESVRSDISNHEVEVQVIPIKHVPAVQMVPILRPLVEKEGHLAAHANSNSLIVAASRRTINKIHDMLATLDQAAESQIDTIKLHHADATEIVKTLQTLVTAGTAAGGKGAGRQGRSKLVADTRTNSLLVSGNKGFREKITRIVRRLDSKVRDTRNIHVVSLRFANAADLAPIIEKLASERSAPAAAVKGKQGSTNSQLTSVQADEQTNSLIITARPDKMSDLRSIIRKLDVRRSQVLVEVIIAELFRVKDAELGIQWIGANNDLLDAAGDILGDDGDAGSSDSQFKQFSQLGVGSIAGLISGGDYSFLALASALDNDSDVNILSTPSLLTMDNEEAEITVGQEVPFVTGSYTGVGDSLPSNPFQTVERKNVGLTLKITPQINEGDAVKLTIDQEISNINQQQTANLGRGEIITNQRTIKTSVIVNNKSILVLGGLIDDVVTETEQRVPFIGDIPILGEAFTHRGSNKTKRNLMLFIQPTILRNNTQNLHATGKRYREMREAQLDKYQKGVPLIGEANQPLLKPRDNMGRVIEDPKTIPPLEPVYIEEQEFEFWTH
ncbi:MAG: type II secretion system secretin GspD [Gammaproteobacteria bacterium]|nr:type II secretion system secretin GspD [Gammaproteobacteria bacterium]